MYDKFARTKKCENLKLLLRYWPISKKNLLPFIFSIRINTIKIQ